MEKLCEYSAIASRLAGCRNLHASRVSLPTPTFELEEVVFGVDTIPPLVTAHGPETLDNTPGMSQARKPERGGRRV